MNSLRPVDLEGAGIKARSYSTPISKKVLVGLLAALIVLAMVVWLGFLGWGMMELLRSIMVGVKPLWAKIL